MSKPLTRPGPRGGTPSWIKSSPSASFPSVMMLHGRSGDESSMWILESVLPEGAMVVAPRGLFPLPEGGFGWSSGEASIETPKEDYGESIHALLRVLAELETEQGLNPSKLFLVGFSQGAAIAFSMVGQRLIRPAGVVSLAGFMPRGKLDGLEGIPIFWGHGLKDESVPVSRARDDVQHLRDLGAIVEYCEEDVGHKLGLACTRGLKTWINTQAHEPVRHSLEPGDP